MDTTAWVMATCGGVAAVILLVNVIIACLFFKRRQRKHQAGKLLPGTENGSAVNQYDNPVVQDEVKKTDDSNQDDDAKENGRKSDVETGTCSNTGETNGKHSSQNIHYETISEEVCSKTGGQESSEFGDELDPYELMEEDIPPSHVGKTDVINAKHNGGTLRGDKNSTSSIYEKETRVEGKPSLKSQVIRSDQKNDTKSNVLKQSSFAGENTVKLDESNAGAQTSEKGPAGSFRGKSQKSGSANLETTRASKIRSPVASDADKATTGYDDDLQFEINPLYNTHEEVLGNPHPESRKDTAAEPPSGSSVSEVYEDNPIYNMSAESLKNQLAEKGSTPPGDTVDAKTTASRLDSIQDGRKTAKCVSRSTSGEENGDKLSGQCTEKLTEHKAAVESSSSGDEGAKGTSRPTENTDDIDNDEEHENVYYNEDAFPPKLKAQKERQNDGSEKSNQNSELGKEQQGATQNLEAATNNDGANQNPEPKNDSAGANQNSETKIDNEVANQNQEAKDGDEEANQSSEGEDDDEMYCNHEIIRKFSIKPPSEMDGNDSDDQEEKEAGDEVEYVNCNDLDGPPAEEMDEDYGSREEEGEDDVEYENTKSINQIDDDMAAGDAQETNRDEDEQEAEDDVDYENTKSINQTEEDADSTHAYSLEQEARTDTDKEIISTGKYSESEVAQEACPDGDEDKSGLPTSHSGKQVEELEGGEHYYNTKDLS